MSHLIITWLPQRAKRVHFKKFQHSQILKYGSQKVVSRLKLFRDGPLSILVSILTLYMPVFMILQNLKNAEIVQFSAFWAAYSHNVIPR